MQIFMVQGAMIGVVGTLLGLVGGVSLALNVDDIVPVVERVFGFKFLARTSTRSPTCPPSCACARRRDDRARCRFVLSLLATLYPSWRAAQRQSGGGAAL